MACSIPSNTAPLDSRSSAARNWPPYRGRASSARRRTSGVGSSSRQGWTSTEATRPVESWVAAENWRRDSISSPQYSRRTGRRSVAGNTSTMPPRTANSPRCSTTSARA